MKGRFIGALIILALVGVLLVPPLVGTAATGDTNFTNVVASGDITAGDDLTVADDAIVSGDLTVIGTTTQTGAPTFNGKLTVNDQVLIDGDSDEIQLTVQGYTTQTASLMVLEQSDGTDKLTVSNDGNLVVVGTSDLQGNISDSAGTLTVADNALIDGAADAEQLVVQGNGTQTSNSFVVEQSDGTDVFTVDDNGVASFRENLQVMTSTEAITVQNGTVLIGSGGALTPTIAAPTSVQDGTILRIYATTAQAHTITATTIGFNALDAAGDVCTLGGAIGDGITIVASSGEWWIINDVNCTLN